MWINKCLRVFMFIIHLNYLVVYVTVKSYCTTQTNLFGVVGDTV